MNRNYRITSGVVFALVALMHAWRFVLGVPVQIGAWSVPQWVSVVAAIVAAALSVWAFRSARAEKPVAVAYT
ncbi:MAG TPA: hypothetical protein VLJ83_07355 [Gemmatimonadaceae bacterium]|nr:hypothetical protein [Gemmatimonadaceae bacterium]